MEGRQQSRTLGDRANECMNKLQQLKDRAERGRSHHSSSTGRLLATIESEIKDSLRLLQSWITDITKGRQTDDAQTVGAVERLLEFLYQSAENAYDSLNSRLQYRRIWLIGFFFIYKRTTYEHRLIRALKAVADNIGQLHAQSKLLLISAKQVDRQAKKADILESTAQPYNAFSEFFDNLKKQDRPHARALALELLWRYFPRWQDVEDKVGNRDDPGDGLVYDSDRVAKAKSILQNLHQAWTNLEDWSECPPPTRLPEMGQICLILTGMRRQYLLEDFLDSGIVDGTLPMNKEDIGRVLKGDNANYTLTFFTEQYRAVPRAWDEGHHLNLEEEEPLPLVTDLQYNQGSYGLVIRVRDSFSRASYAQKKQLVTSDEHENDAARKHLKDETERLKDLRHRHVVRFVKSYQRGRAYGFLLKPAATTDLERLIDRFYKDKFSSKEDCYDKQWLRPVFLTAFGCLSRGLAYVHAHNIRHKDVKPANILYETATETNEGARLLWADFGLAYDFSAIGSSKTRSSKIYSKRYAAPEILAANSRLVTERRTSVLSNLDIIPEDGKEMIVDAKIESDFQEDEQTGHGRKTDIFSLGCVFLELLGSLRNERLPLIQQRPRTSQHESGDRLEEHAPDAPQEASKDDTMFCNQISELTAWARRYQQPDQEQDLTPLLELAIKMISVNPRDRPDINDVVRSIVAAGPKHFCDSCWLECDKRRQSTSSKCAEQPPQMRKPLSPRSPSPTMLQRVNSKLSMSSQTARPLSFVR